MRKPRAATPAVLALLVVVGAGTEPANAAAYPEQRAQLARATSLLSSAERLAKRGRLEAAVKDYREADQLLRAVAAELDLRLERRHKRAVERRAEIHAKLTAAGAALDPLPAAGESDPEKSERGKSLLAAANGAAKPRPAGAVSFVRQVAPLLAAKCGRCHVDGDRGGFSLATFERLMAGSRTGGRVLVPGDGVGSLLVDLIASGDMPRGGGGRVTSAETRMLVDWINQGARFDGDDPTKNLRELTVAAGAAAGGDAPAEAARPTGRETVSFSADVAPLLNAKCGECHVTNNRGRFQMADFRQLMRGEVVTRGDPDRSPLVRRIRGDDSPRMPLRRPPLSEAEIETVATWVREGARFDGEPFGVRPTDRLGRVAAVANAAKATGDELNRTRAEGADRMWRTALSDVPAGTATTNRFLVVGSLTAARLRETADRAERAAEGVAKFFDDEAPRLGKSRVTLFAFADRLDYGEFGSMVERRQLPRLLTGHWRHDAVNPYACVLQAGDAAPTPGDDFVLAEQVAALWIAGRAAGRAPEWLVTGAARVVAARVEPRAPFPKEWDQQVPALVRQMPTPTSFMEGKLAPELVGVVGYGFAKPMLRKPARFGRLLDTIAEGAAPEEAIERVYGRPAEELAADWVRSVASRR